MMDILSRTHTTPVPASHSRYQVSSMSSNDAQNHHQSLPHHSHYSSQYSHPSRSSSSTQHTHSSTLFPQPPTSAAAPQRPSQTDGVVSASNNVINKVADKEASLFQVCVSLTARLRGVPDFAERYDEEEAELGDGADPVQTLWKTLQQGYPLMDLYNMLDPDYPLFVDESKIPEHPPIRRMKAATFQFISACVQRLGFPTSECFILNDLYNTEPSGFVKVTKVVNRVVDICIQQGILDPHELKEDDVGKASTTFKRTHRQYVVDELVQTERTYVQHLEILQTFKKLVEQKGIIAGDTIHNIFLNLTVVLDWQHHFLIRVEKTNAMREDEQNWGHLFKQAAASFKVYEPYIANQKRSESTVVREFDRLKTVGGPPEMRQIVESPTHLTGFLLKPFQRLSKYPILLKELRDKCDLDERRRDDLSEGIDGIVQLLSRANSLIDQDERQEAAQYLMNQVEDWKGHRVDGFGTLLLFGTFTVIKGDTSKDSEREYKMYLFEKILLCCKEAKTDKQKSKLMSKPQPTPLKNGKPRLHLKGRIFFQNVTDITTAAKSGSYSCQIYWRGDEAIEFFQIRFQTEDLMKKWQAQIETQRRLAVEPEVQSQRVTQSETQFDWINSQGQLQNPYLADENSVDTGHDHNMSHNGSNPSLRSRSNTGESGPPIANRTTSKPGMGPGGPQLTLRTQQLSTSSISPAERAAQASYFSPTGVESPISSRTSSSSGILAFPRQPTPSNGWHNDEQNARYTAPAMGRPNANTQNSYHGIDPRSGRPQQGSHSMHAASLSQNRLRSASSPDIHNANGQARRMPSDVPPVPSVPTRLQSQTGPINRSQSNSPLNNATSPGPKRPSQLSNSGHQYSNDSMSTLSRTVSPTSGQVQSHMSLTPNGEAPSQLKVKVQVPSAPMTLTLVVSTNISYQSLKSRIDAKLSRATQLSLSSGSVRLKYFDDDTYISIQTDDDVQDAFETWTEQHGDINPGMQMGEIELYCIKP